MRGGRVLSGKHFAKACLPKVALNNHELAEVAVQDCWSWNGKLIKDGAGAQKTPHFICGGELSDNIG